MPAAEGKFALVLLDDAPIAYLAEIAGELAAMLGRVRYDVIGAFKRSPHIPLEDLEAAQAAAAVGVLSNHGARAAAMPVARLPAFPRVLKVHNVQLSEKGLSVQTDLVGTMQEVPWGEVAALAAATISEGSGPSGPAGPSVGQQVAGAAARAAVGVAIGLPGMGLGAPKVHKAPAPKVEVYQLLAVGCRSVPLELHFRHDQLGYECLGPRMTANAALNFRLFAGELLARAAGARVGEAFRALVRPGTAPPPMAADALARYTRWLKLMACERL